MRRFLCIVLLMNLCACNVGDRLDRVGRTPEFKKVNTYEEEIYDTYAAKGLTDPIDRINNEQDNGYKTANSLWRPGSRTFFRDQRARSVGDILKVIITIQDKAKMDNQTQTSRNDTSNLGIPNFLGIESQLGKVLPEAVNPSKLVGVKSADANSGLGKIDRKETINTTFAATVIKILPSNNLVIKGTQEIKINTEVREITIEGIVRPEDINSSNAVTLDQIAEARVTYGGRGNISDYQQPRYGKQILDAISPF
ncbi:MAG: flagellar basal body L-ring protein FlgH [Candidatus Jidaibacter sp.]|jgi:flagellar L-ring protein precursor FlgH|nr:flagellar basal body L-ring protein FlgH [Candidatus Jidaibacter sp.]